MDVQDLEVGQHAPAGSDRIVVSGLPSGQFGFAGVVKNGAVQAHFFDHGAFSTLEEAREAGIAWAAELKVGKLLIEHPDS